MIEEQWTKLIEQTVKRYSFIRKLLHQQIKRSRMKGRYLNKLMNNFKSIPHISEKPSLGYKIALSCFIFMLLSESVSAMQPRLRSDQVARYINLTKITGKEPLPTTFLSTTELIAARSLVPEEHYVITDDGYILALYRLYNHKTVNFSKPPVLIIHGLLATSDSWIVGDRSTSLPIFLADMGYDVWLGDQRGNANSRMHVYMKPKTPAFWNFSFHESGLYDLPAFIDKVLSRSCHNQLIYIGHSMATAAFLVMTSSRPEYNSKIKLSCLLAPVAYLRSVRELEPLLYQITTNRFDLVIRSLERIGLYEVFPRSNISMQLTKIFCGNMLTQPLCLLVLQIGFRQNVKNIDLERTGFMFSYIPAGASLKNLAHFRHNIASGRFQYYDYGAEKNKKYYNNITPPVYDLKKVTCPVALYYSLSDIFLNKRSVMKTARELPRVVQVYQVPDKKYSHADYVIGLNSKEVLFKDILQVIMKYE